MGTGKKHDNDILADAYLALTGEYSPYDTSEHLTTVPTQIVLQSKIPNPEKLLIHKQMYERLSPEAKEIISLVIHNPDRIFETLGFQRVTKRTVRLYFTHKFMSKWITQKTIDEITTWASQL